MRREIFIHFSFWFSFFVFVTLVNRFFEWQYLLFWLGGVLGTLLPDIDHLLYLYLNKQELTTQRVGYLMDKQEIKRTIQVLYDSRGQRRDLIFHTVYFQLIFVVLTFWIITSSDSLFGQGLVLAFYLHLLIDQIVDLNEMQTFDNWLKNSPFKLDLTQAKLYWLVLVILLILLGVLA